VSEVGPAVAGVQGESGDSLVVRRTEYAANVSYHGLLIVRKVSGLLPRRSTVLVTRDTRCATCVTRGSTRVRITAGDEREKFTPHRRASIAALDR